MAIRHFKLPQIETLLDWSYEGLLGFGFRFGLFVELLSEESGRDAMVCIVRTFVVIARSCSKAFNPKAILWAIGHLPKVISERPSLWELIARRDDDVKAKMHRLRRRRILLGQGGISAINIHN